MNELSVNSIQSSINHSNKNNLDTKSLKAHNTINSQSSNNNRIEQINTKKNNNHNDNMVNVVNTKSQDHPYSKLFSIPSITSNQLIVVNYCLKKILENVDHQISIKHIEKEIPEISYNYYFEKSFNPLLDIYELTNLYSDSRNLHNHKKIIKNKENQKLSVEENYLDIKVI